MEPLTFVLFLAGIGVLILGAEVLVRGAARLAAALGIPPLIIGLTVVAFGTSSPEVAVAVQASRAGLSDIAFGNVVGSNVANVLLILGLAALLTPLIVSRQLVRREVPLMIAVSALVMLLAFDGLISQHDGTLLLVGMVAYTAFVIRQSRKERAHTRTTDEIEYGWNRRTARAWAPDLAAIVGGLVLLTLGARWLVDGAVVFARVLGVSDLVIGLTIVAVGTSLPEIATTVLASLRRERDIAVGNVIGSCIFNLLLVLGLAAWSTPAGVALSPAALSFDLPVMIAAAVACLPIFFNGHAIYRWEGGLSWVITPPIPATYCWRPASTECWSLSVW